MSSKKFLLILPAAIALALPSSRALAVHAKNAGPAEVVIKFNLPPPKPLSPEETLKTFKIEKGFRIELVAAEPMVESPVAMSFDDQGRLFVVEMRGYMHDLEGSTEKEPSGRVSLLEDTDGDGRMDKSSVFLDQLVMPRSVLAVNGGALVAVPPNLLFCKDTDGDGRADVKDIVATDYGTLGGQPEHMPNTPVWAMDNAVWSAGYGARFILRGGAWQRDTGLSRGQWGLTQDDAGRLYFNYNSDLLRCDLLPAEAFTRHPLLRNAASVNAKLVTDQSVWPSHPTPGVNRGYSAGTLRADGSLAKVTATCGPVIYRGDALPGCRGNAFIPEPGGNLVKRMILREKDGLISAANALAGRDFLTSTDERFRPVQAVNAPDGALYIADMSRGIIQHGSFLTHYLIANIKARKLEQPFNQGRIWRVVHESQPAPKPVRIPADAASRVKMLDHASGWVRDAAQRLLVETGGTEAIAPLAAILKSAESAPLARLHALWTLHGLGALTPEFQRIAIKDSDPQVRAAAFRNATRDIVADLITPSAERHPLVQAHLAVKLSSLGMPDADVALARLLVVAGKSALVREGALTGLRGRESAFAKMFASTEKSSLAPEVLESLAALVAMAGKAQPIGEMLALAAAQKPGSTAQSALLKGLAVQSGDRKDKSSAPVKLVWMDGPQDALAKLSAANPKGASASLVRRISERIAWPGKPGAPEPPKIVPLTPAQTALFEKGRVVFQTLCAACHQQHGFGLDGLAPPLVDSEWVLGRPDVPARIIMHGLAGPMKVGSRTWNLAMPPLPQLSDEDVAAVLTYIRREWEHNASPVEPSLITELRAKNKGRAAMWTADELKKK